MPRVRFPNSWALRGLPVLAACSAVEIAQYFGYPIFGCAYDPLDFAMYTAGVGSAALFDTVVFPRIFPSWTLDLRQKGQSHAI